MSINSIHKPHTRGIALVEILVATSVITGALLVLLASVQKSVELSRQSLERVQAGFLLEEGAEDVKIIRDNGWSTITALSAASTYYISTPGGADPVLTTTVSKIGAFTRTVTIANVSRDTNSDIVTSGGTVDTGTKKITVTVSWNSERGTLTETMSFYISDIFS